jgi:putative transport protein
MRLRSGQKAEDAASRVDGAFGRVVRPSTATDLLTLSMGMILGRLIGRIQFSAFNASLGPGMPEDC